MGAYYWSILLFISLHSLHLFSASTYTECKDAKLRFVRITIVHVWNHTTFLRTNAIRAIPFLIYYE